MFTSVIIYMGGTYGLLGMLVGVVLIVLWITRVKNTRALFYDKAKIRATLFLGVPGLIFFLLGAYYRFVYVPSFPDFYSDYSYNAEDYVPTLAYIHFVNKSDKNGRIEVGDQKEEIPAGKWEKIAIETKKDSDTLRAWLGDSLVLDTIIREGTYLGNFSDDITAVAEEIMYSTSSYTSTEDLEYIMLTGPGIERFTSTSSYSIYDYDQEAPASITMPQYSSNVRKWDLKLVTSDELMQMLLDAIKEEGGDVNLLDSEEEE